MLNYGRVFTEQVYDDGSIKIIEEVLRAKTVINTIVRNEESVPILNLQELWNNIIQQVSRLQTEDSITLTIECERHTREPNRMVINSKHLIK